MNRFETELKARRGIINGRKWRCDRYGGAARLVISEIRLNVSGDAELVYRDHWSQPNIGFRTLELAGCDRRRAMTIPAYRTDKIEQHKRWCREGIERSRDMRLDAEPPRFEMRKAA
jgi:hypothetical protein